MKRYLFICLTLCALFVGQRLKAQRYLPKMQGVELRGGFVDGFKSANNFYGGIALSTYTKHKDRWVFGVEYLQKGYDYREITIPKSQFTAEVGYYYMLTSNASKTLFFSIGGSALSGYETLAWGERMLYDGATLMNKDAFIYGGAITFEIETYISDRVVLLLNARERVMFGSTVGNLHFQLGAGFKFIIN